MTVHIDPARPEWVVRQASACVFVHGERSRNDVLITYEAQLPVSGLRWQGFRRLGDDLSGWIDRHFAPSNDPPTPIGHPVRAQAEDCA